MIFKTVEVQRHQKYKGAQRNTLARAKMSLPAVSSRSKQMKVHKVQKSHPNSPPGEIDKWDGNDTKIESDLQMNSLEASKLHRILEMKERLPTL